MGICGLNEPYILTSHFKSWLYNHHKKFLVVILDGKMVTVTDFVSLYPLKGIKIHCLGQHCYFPFFFQGSNRKIIWITCIKHFSLHCNQKYITSYEGISTSKIYIVIIFHNSIFNGDLSYTWIKSQSRDLYWSAVYLETYNRFCRKKNNYDFGSIFPDILFDM